MSEIPEQMLDGVYYEKRFPGIPWRQPLPTTIGRRAGYICRVCGARKGLHGHETERLYTNESDCRRHIREHFE